MYRKPGIIQLDDLWKACRELVLVALLTLLTVTVGVATKVPLAEFISPCGLPELVSRKDQGSRVLLASGSIKAQRWVEGHSLNDVATSATHGAATPDQVSLWPAFLVVLQRMASKEGRQIHASLEGL